MGFGGFSGLFLSFALATLLWAAPGRGLGVEIDEYWGQLDLRVDEDITTFKCVATEATPDGDFQWLIGDEVQFNTFPKEGADGQYSQEFRLIPQIKHDGKPLTCRYSGKGESQDSETITLAISYWKLPSGPVNAGVYQRDTPILLEASFEMYPPPSDDDVTWIITEVSGEKTKLRAGLSKNGYNVGKLQNDDGITYTSFLTIETPSSDENAKTHQLRIRLQDVEKSVPVTFKFADELIQPEVAPPVSIDRPTYKLPLSNQRRTLQL